ncbi:MAG: NAD(P)/FAD-dependent oxidoreductase, partial [Pseudomonadota bacterium]
PLPDELTDFVEFSFLSLMNEYLWSQQPGLDDWKRANRLDGFGATIAAIPKDDAAKHEIMKRIRKNAVPAVENLQRLMTANAGSTATAH